MEKINRLVMGRSWLYWVTKRINSKGEKRIVKYQKIKGEFLIVDRGVMDIEGMNIYVFYYLFYD